jgi:hypothetical protein
VVAGSVAVSICSVVAAACSRPRLLLRQYRLLVVSALCGKCCVCVHVDCMHALRRRA